MKPEHPKRATALKSGEDGFEVTCSIGRVVFRESEEDGMGPYEAALMLIAKHGVEGVYSFPQANGGTTRVEITFGVPPEVGDF